LKSIKSAAFAPSIPQIGGRADSLKEGKEFREVMFELARGFGE
jgi:hypothetical protein